MTKEQARLDIFKQINMYLQINPLDYIRFSEELSGNCYSVTLTNKNCNKAILACCEDMSDKNARVVIVKF